MSRSHFALAIALLVIAATMVFVKTFPDAPAVENRTQSARALTPERPGGGVALEPSHVSKPRTPRPETGTRLEIGFSPATLATLTDDQRRQALGFAARAEADARATLDALTEKYELTRQQRRDLFPIVAAHTPSYHPSMTVDGVSVAPAPAGSSLEEEIHGELDPDQQAVLEDAMVDDIKWWQEIASQLEDDLNQAIDAGEVSVAPPADAGIPVDTQPAPGDGEAASHSGGNIFDLLNQGN